MVATSEEPKKSTDYTPVAVLGYMVILAVTIEVLYKASRAVGQMYSPTKAHGPEAVKLMLCMSMQYYSVLEELGVEQNFSVIGYEYSVARLGFKPILIIKLGSTEISQLQFQWVNTQCIVPAFQNDWYYLSFHNSRLVQQNLFNWD